MLKDTTKTIPALLLELSVTEMAVPCHLMWMSAQPLPLSGHILRRDVVHNLNRASAAALTPLAHDLLAIKRVAYRVDQAASRILRDVNPNDTLHAFYVSCMFVLVLVDEGLLADAQSMAVLVALSCINDLKEHGAAGDFTFKEKVLKAEAMTMLDAARKEGLYRNAGTVPLQPLLAT